MTSSDRPLTLKEKLDRLTHRDFIGRDKDLTAFRTSLSQPDPDMMFFSISGQGGIGKTTLLKQFRRIVEQQGQVAAYVDEGAQTNRVEDVPEAIDRLVKDLEVQGFKFEKFRERYKVYRQKKQELEADPEAPSGLAAGLGRFGAKAAMGSIKVIPGVGEAIGDWVDVDATAEQAGNWVSFAWSKFRNKDEVQLVTERLEVLTPLFVEELNRITADRTVVLLLDTYEQTGQFLDEWLRSLLDGRYGGLNANFRLCVAGRKPLDRNLWAGFEPLIARSPLEPFTEAEARLFLMSRGISSGAVLAEIWQLSAQGLPLLVSMMAETAPTSPDAVVDACSDAVERFLKWETNEQRRQMAQDAALPRLLNQDVVAAVLEGEEFGWLKDCAFVLEHPEGWQYHTVVREPMLRYQRKLAPQRWARLHEKLAVYYQNLRQGLGLEEGQQRKDPIWQKYQVEWLYHSLSAAPQAQLGVALNGFLAALKSSRAFAESWAETIAQAGLEGNCEEVKRWGERLRDGLKARREERYKEAIPALTALLENKQIEPKMRAVALWERANQYRSSKQYGLVLPDLERAVEIDADDSEYWKSLGIAYSNLKRYEEAITAYEHAIALDSNYAAPHNNLGNVYKDLKRYEEAITAYSKAIALNNEYRWAFASRGKTYLLLKQPEQALPDLNRAIELDSQKDWFYCLRALANLALNQPKSVQADFAIAIDLAQTAHDNNPLNWRNVFTLMLYHIIADQGAIATPLYEQAQSAPSEWLQMAIDDLSDFLSLFPNHSAAEAMQKVLNKALQKSHHSTVD